MFHIISSNKQTQTLFKQAYLSLNPPIAFPSYKAFISFFHLPDYSTKPAAKAKQLDKLSSFFEIERVGRKFKILSTKKPNILPPVYSLQTMREKSITPTFKLLTNYLLLNFLKQHYIYSSDNKVVTTKKDIALELGFINSVFYNTSFIQEKVASNLNCDYFTVRKFYEVISRSYGSIIDKSLKELEKAGLLLYQNVIYGYDEKSKSKRSLTDDEIKVYTKGINEYFKINDVYSMQDIFLKGKRNDFYSFIKKYLKENIGIGTISKKVVIFFNEEMVDRCLGDSEDINEDINEEKEFLNGKFRDKQYENFIRRNDKGWGIMKKNVWGSKEDFYLLSDVLLDINENVKQLVLRGKLKIG